MTDAVIEQFRTAGEDLFRCGLVVPGSDNVSVWTPAGVIVTREGAALHRSNGEDKR